MHPFVLIVLFHLWLLHNTAAQSGTPRCVPVGYCFPQPPIDVNPRIVVPDGGPPQNNTQGCAQGYELCFPYQGQLSCGTRYTNGVSNADGPTKRGSHPWQVYLVNETGSYIGSGVLITENIVLTAAHKVYKTFNTPNKLIVFMGVNNPADGKPLRGPPAVPPAEFSPAAQIGIHENFKVNTANNQPEDYKDDIALVLLERPASIGYRTDLGVACFPSTDNFEGNNRGCFVGGWGETQFRFGDAGQIHKQVHVPVVSMATCKQSMLNPNVLGAASTAKYLDEKNEFCAGGESQRDACTQDGGAPLMCPDPEAPEKFVVAGIVIWGKGCGREGVYGVYVNVAKYTNWIEEGINALLSRK